MWKEQSQDVKLNCSTLMRTFSFPQVMILALLLCHHHPTVVNGLVTDQRRPFHVRHGEIASPDRSPTWSFSSSSSLHSAANSEGDEAERYRRKAEELREQIRKMEEALPAERRRTQPDVPSRGSGGGGTAAETEARPPPSLLANRRVLVVGSNGRLGSMVCRHLLRRHPELKEVIACVHVVGENSDTARGYGRLSYEVGAEDGTGTIGPAWSAQDERTARFEFDAETMAGHNLQKLRVVECELLDPVQVATIVENSEADVVVWCATDFNGNRPRAVGGLNVAFLFRAVTAPDKGRVEVEGLQNLLGALKRVRQEQVQRNRLVGGSAGSATATTTAAKPVDILLVSVDPNAMEDFETPFGTFYDQKRQGERMIPNEFPSLRYTTIQFGLFEDNFVGEDLEIQFQPVEAGASVEAFAKPAVKGRRRINRRDAARAVADALTRPDLQGKTVQAWTDERP